MTGNYNFSYHIKYFISQKDWFILSLWRLSSCLNCKLWIFQLQICKGTKIKIYSFSYLNGSLKRPCTTPDFVKSTSGVRTINKSPINSGSHIQVWYFTQSFYILWHHLIVQFIFYNINKNRTHLCLFFYIISYAGQQKTVIGSRPASSVTS